MNKVTLRKIFKTIEEIASNMDVDTFNELEQYDIDHMIGEFELIYGEEGTKLIDTVHDVLVVVKQVL